MKSYLLLLRHAAMTKMVFKTVDDQQFMIDGRLIADIDKVGQRISSIWVDLRGKISRKS